MRSIAVAMIRGTLRTVRGNSQVASVLRELEEDLSKYTPPKSSLETDDAKRFSVVPSAETETRRCSFCGRERREVLRMLASSHLGASICERCLVVCDGLLD